MSILVIHKQPRPEALKIHESCLSEVQRVLTQVGQSFQVFERSELPKVKPCEDDLFITIGGDGTLLDTSHYVDSQTVFGVNSNPQSSVGSLCVASALTFASVFEQFLKGALKPTQVTRMALILNGRILDKFALNDVLVANQNPAATTRYEIQVGSQKALHKNSGLWVSTACGSTGAVCSTRGEVQSLEDTRLQWVCREPYFAELPIPGLLSGFLNQGESIYIKSLSDGGRIFIDGPHTEESFESGDTLLLSMAKKALSCVVTPEMETRRQQIGLLRRQSWA